MLVVQVQALESLAGLQVQEEVARVGPRARQAALGSAGQAHSVGVLGRVERPRAVAEDLFRDVVQPPVDQVEMVGGLVDQQRAAAVAVAVPSAEIVGPVLRIERPGVVHAEDLADVAAVEHLLDLAAGGRIAVVERHLHVAPSGGASFEDLATALVVGGHGLFGHHVTAQLHRADDVVAVGDVRPGGDDHAVGLGLGDHPIELIGGVGGHFRVAGLLQIGVVQLQSAGVDVADADHFGVVAEVAGNGLQVHAAAAAEADVGITGSRIRGHRFLLLRLAALLAAA